MSIFKKAQSKNAIMNFLSKEEVHNALKKKAFNNPTVEQGHSAEKTKHGWMACVLFFYENFDVISKEDVNQIPHHMLKILSTIEDAKPGITFDGYERGFRNAIYAIQKTIKYLIDQKKKERIVGVGIEP